MMDVPYRFKAWPTTYDEDVAQNPFQQNTYLPNIHLTRRIFANGWVKWFNFFVRNFETEWYWDWFPFGREGPDNPGYWLSGPSGNAGYWYGVQQGDDSLQYEPGFFIFESNNNTQMQGVLVDGLEVCSRPTLQGPGASAYLYPNQRDTGVLLGQNDVVYFQLGGLPGAHQTIALWGDYPNDVGSDFDLYVRCGLPPTPTEWDYRGYSSDTNEFIHFDNTWCQGTMYVAVHSYHGYGMFNIMVNYHWASQHFPVAYANVTYPADPTDYAIWQSYFLLGNRAFFGATEGTVYVDELHIWNNNGNSNAAFQLRGTCGRSESGYKGCSNWGFGSGPINIYKYSDTNNCDIDSYRDRTIAHELGHWWAGLDDEYDDNGGHCGHTIMDRGFTSTVFNFCRAEDHDSAHWPGAGPAPGGPGWTNSCLAGHAPYVPTETPDNFNFETFDFNNLYGRLVIH